MNKDLMASRLRSTRYRMTSQPRSATTLVEVLVTLSVLLVMGISAVKLLGSVTEIGTQRNLNDLGRASIERLAIVFRDDVHGAEQASTADGAADDSRGWPLSLTRDQGRIEYDLDGPAHSIRRSEYRSQDRVSTEVFRLPKRCDPSCQVDDGLVSIQLTPADQAPQWILEASRR